MKMNYNKNVNNKDLINCLVVSIDRTNDCLDYIYNKINHCRDLLQFNEDDINAQEELSILEHIRFCLTYLNDSFTTTLGGLS